MKIIMPQKSFVSLLPYFSMAKIPASLTIFLLDVFRYCFLNFNDFLFWVLCIFKRSPFQISGSGLRQSMASVY